MYKLILACLLFVPVIDAAFVGTYKYVEVNGNATNVTAKINSQPEPEQKYRRFTGDVKNGSMTLEGTTADLEAAKASLISSGKNSLVVAQESKDINQNHIQIGGFKIAMGNVSGADPKANLTFAINLLHVVGSPAPVSG